MDFLQTMYYLLTWLLFYLLHLSHCSVIFEVFFARCTLALVTVVTATHTNTHTRLHFCVQSVAYKIYPFSLKFLRLDQRSELILLLSFLLQEKISVQTLFFSFEGQKLKTKVIFRKNALKIFKA